jgi:hypothetical protein
MCTGEVGLVFNRVQMYIFGGKYAIIIIIITQ